jgi:putative hydrolase of the HAD superfamily
VDRPKACLVDVYNTILRCDFVELRTELPALVGVPADVWRTGYDRIDGDLNTGRLSKSEAFGQLLRDSGVAPRPALLRALVDRDRELLLATARLYDDAIGFLKQIRARGSKIAIVSNCSEHTRPLLTELGIDVLVDALVLSCEVGAAKPDAKIFRSALDQLDVTADAAVFVDDQADYCAGAVALGITTAQIIRGEPNGKVVATGATVVRSLRDVEPMLQS